MIFWVVVATMVAASVAILLQALVRARRGDPEARAASDVAIYRDQLREIERDVARGIIGADEAERLRTEVSRRLLDADRAARSAEGKVQGGAPRAATWTMAAFAVAVTAGGSVWLYAALGAPGYGDLPMSLRLAAAEQARETRPGQTDAEVQAGAALAPREAPDPQYLELIERLRAAVAARPDDLEGHRLLARNEAAMGDFAAAWRAQERVVEIRGAEATAQDHANLADLMVLAAGGYVSPEAEAALSRALDRDPSNGTARYYSGLLFAQTGRPDIAFNLWRGLLEESQPDAPWVGPIRAQIEDLAFFAGVDYRLPPEGSAPLRGPSAADIEAAGDLDPAARMEMIRSMVGGLSERLATEGGPPADWARLIRAYGVLGERGTAAAIWEEAQRVFPDDLARVPILEAARDAGVAQ